jgi:hypothetical protein
MLSLSNGHFALLWHFSSYTGGRLSLIQQADLPCSICVPTITIKILFNISFVAYYFYGCGDRRLQSLFLYLLRKLGGYVCFAQRQIWELRLPERGILYCIVTIF